MSYTGNQENKPIDIVESIETTIDFIEEIYKKNNINIIKDFPEKSLTVIGQNSKLQQVILNFLSNAKDAIVEKGDGGEIIVSLLADGDNIVLKVKDDGIGIDEENINKIFNTFFTTKDEGSGTGMGLSISMSILKNMDAKIDVESQKGSGATFKVIFPKVQALEEQVEANVEVINADYSALKDKRVLFVEDETDISQIMSEALREVGLNVKIANNGLEALNFLKGFKPDVIVTDIQMPEMNGFEMIKKIEEIDYKCPIIISTGGGLAELENKVNQDLVIFVMRKPYDDSELIEKIQNVLNK